MRKLTILLVLAVVLLVATAAQAQDPQTAPPTQTPYIIFVNDSSTPAPVIVVLPTAAPDRLSDAVPYMGKSAVVAGDPLPSLLAEIDQDITAIWPTISARQTAYFRLTGHYFQGLASSDVIPQDGIETLPDNYFENPTDQSYRWNDIKIIPYVSLPYQVIIDTYDGPEGKGYVCRFRIVVDGALWERDVNEGGEVYRDIYWFNPILRQP